ncbi:hypothetical protein CWO90_06620 [Bradyrhizobium sp. Leo121]|nr:hypothetical protein CWO90_06620 [Bradyrhizobium sp. Leo121]
MHATVRLGTAHRPGAGLLRLRKAGEPRLDSSQHPQKAARLQELPAPAATGRQVATKSFLIDVVHMEEAIRGAIVKGGVLDILADDTHSLLVAAAKEVSAGVMVIVSVLARVFEL